MRATVAFILLVLLAEVPAASPSVSPGVAATLGAGPMSPGPRPPRRGLRVIARPEPSPRPADPRSRPSGPASAIPAIGHVDRRIVYRLDGGRDQVVVALGAAFEPGRFDDAAREIVVTAGAARRAAQTRVLARHDDGSVALARLHVALRPTATGTALGLELRERKEPEVSPFVVVEAAEGLRVSNGKLRFLLPRDPSLACSDLRLEGAARSALVGLRTGLAQGPAELDVEESGPQRLVLRQRGLVAAAALAAPLRLDRRLQLDRDQARLTIETWLEPATTVMPELQLDHQLELGFAPRRLILSNEALDLATLEAGLHYDRFGRSTEPEVAVAIAEDGLLLQGDGLGLRIEVEDLQERGPGSIQLVDRQLGLPLVSSSYRWRVGRAASRRLVIGLARGGRSRPAVAPRLVVRRPDEGPPAAGVAGAEILRRLRQVAGRALEAEARREQGFDWRGELNWGDWRWSKMDAGNLEYDAILGLRLAARGLDRPALLLRSRAALAHLIRVDREPGGLVFRHGPGHIGGLEAGHMWLEGALLEALADADPFLLERLGQTVTAWRGMVKRMRPERELCRSLAWSIVSATALHRELGLDLRSELEPLYRAIGAAPGGAVPLFDRLPTEPGEETRYLVSPWVTIGLLGEALALAPEAPGLVGARARWRGAVRALAGQVWNEAEDWPQARIILDAEGGDRGRGGRMEGEEALFLALGLARLEDPDGAERDLAERALRWGAANLALEHKSLVGIELAQLLWLLFRFEAR